MLIVSRGVHNNKKWITFRSRFGEGMLFIILNFRTLLTIWGFFQVPRIQGHLSIAPHFPATRDNMTKE